jgi:hypothetical protein
MRITSVAFDPSNWSDSLEVTKWQPSGLGEFDELIITVALADNLVCVAKQSFE